ncbi:MAG TPA: tRNA dihydrouridine synthase DusB [Acidimicrobiales bacterium]
MSDTIGDRRVAARPARPLRIGSLEPVAPVVLAPMAGVTDHAFRTLCREIAPGLLYVSEMLTARALVEGGDKTLAMLPPPDEPAPRSVQLYGTAPGTLHEAVRRLVEEHDVQHVDLNFGCPVPKVTRKGGGAAVPVRRRLFADIVSAAAKAAAGGGATLTVKFRLGIDDRLQTYLDAGRIAEAEGAAAVALHARTAEQRYAGAARWEAIGELKAAVQSIPVLGNGDIWTADDALRMMAATGCDGVVIGRGCLGRPWLFADLLDAFAGKPTRGPRPLGDVIAVLRRHADLLVEAVGELNAMRTLRRHVGWYMQGYPIGETARRELRLISTRAELDRLLDRLDPTLWQIDGTFAIPRGRTDGPYPVTLPDGWLDLVDDPTPPAGADIGVSGG